MPRPRFDSSPDRLRQQSMLKFVSHGDGSSSSPTAAKPSSRTQTRHHHHESDEEEDSQSDVERIRFSARPIKAVVSESESGDDVRPSIGNVATPQSAHTEVISLLSDDEMDEEAESFVKKRPITTSSAFGSSDEEADDDQPVKRRRLFKGKKPSEGDLSDEVDEGCILESRLRNRDKSSRFQRNLEKLKRKKNAAYVSSGEDDEESEGSPENDVPFFGSKPAGDDSGDSGDQVTSEEGTGDEEDDFIVADDDDDDVGAAKLPVAFSMVAHQSLSHHFKIICQLFVHLAVRPANDREAFMKRVMKDEEYFSVPLQMMRNKLRGIRDSTLSSVWTPKFRKTLEKYPEFYLTALDFHVPHCDACHLGGRLSTLSGRAHGKPYDKFSFKDVKGKRQRDDDGPGKEFNLGRFCATRVKLFHRLTHWEHNLFRTILLEVDELRRGSKFVRVGYYKGLLPPADLTDADGIMDWLDQRGFVKLEWEKIRELMESSSNLDARRDGDDVDT